MFSPYYARARARGAGDPLDHCALNIALYGKGSARWALTERRRGAVRRDASNLVLGPSALAWTGDGLTIRIDERTFPRPSRIRGEVRLTPAGLTGRTFALDAAGRHRWSPLAPVARVEVALERPALRWSGAAYFDANAGDEPLERGFDRWTWSRAARAGGEDTYILYDVARRDGSTVSLALACDAAARIDVREPPPAAALPRTRWAIARATRADDATASVAATLEDTPFYARSLVRSRLFAAPCLTMHESLSLRRFETAWVRALLPFRMPRAW